MREIKFRGKRIDTGDWVYGGLFIDKHGLPAIIVEFDSKIFGMGVDSSTIGQYTGLKDKAGVEIYEGDIVKADDGYATDSIHTVKYCIEDKYPAFDLDPCYDEDSNGIQAAIFGGTIEVLGNIHDNPELLEDTK